MHIHPAAAQHPNYDSCIAYMGFAAIIFRDFFEI